MFLSGFQKFLHSKTGPLVNWSRFNHLKTGQVWDPHCIDHRYRDLGWRKIVQCHLILPRYRVCCSEQDKRVRVCAFDWRPRQIFGRAIIEVLQGWDYIVGVQLLHEGAVLCAVLHYKDLQQKNIATKKLLCHHILPGGGEGVLVLPRFKKSVLRVFSSLASVTSQEFCFFCKQKPVNATSKYTHNLGLY